MSLPFAPVNRMSDWTLQSDMGQNSLWARSQQLGRRGRPLIWAASRLLERNVASSLDTAKQVLAANEAVLYGIFGVVGASGYFPPLRFLNEFLVRGQDPCDQDGRMPAWQPLTLGPEEYGDLQAWWVAGHPGATEDNLGVDSWDEWVQEIIDP